MKIHLNILEDLKTLALTGNHPKVWVAAALVHRNKVISYGLNSMKSHTFQKRYGKNEHAVFLHAEVDCIRNAKKLRFDRFDGCMLYVARVKYNNTEKERFIDGLAMPCEGCMRCINDFGIRGVVYTMDENVCGDNFGVICL